MKGLNPRKGIETFPLGILRFTVGFCQRKPNPRKGIETVSPCQICWSRLVSQKEANPRKGIETLLPCAGHGDTSSYK